MAIIDTFEVEILVNGEPLPEFDDDEEDGVHNAQRSTQAPTVVKYVQAASGQEFSIRYRLYGRHLPPVLHLGLNFDGKHVPGEIVYTKSTPSDLVSWIKSGVQECRGGQWYEKHFKFADLVTIDSNPNRASTEALKARYSNLGLLTITVAEYERLSDSKARSSTFDLDIGEVPEKALKGQPLSMSASLGEARPCHPQNRCHGYDIERLATFEFKYRSRADLQTLMIIPRDIPLEERPIDDLTAEEARELLRRRRQTTLQDIKPFIGSSSAHKRNASTSTPIDDRATKHQHQDGEIIDLTNDSDENEDEDGGSGSGSDGEGERNEDEVEETIEAVDLF